MSSDNRTGIDDAFTGTGLKLTLMPPINIWTVWSTPAPTPLPLRSWLTWLPALVGVAALAIELALRNDLVWPLFGFAASTVAAIALLWRVTHPLAAAAISFGAQTLTDVASLLGASGSAVMYTTVFVLILPYSLTRWGSGKQAVLGLGVILTLHTLREFVIETAVVEAAAQTMFWLVPALLGVLVRQSVTSRDRERSQVRALERERLARDLHDTVAHHVSAIALQAEGGLAWAEAGPGPAQQEHTIAALKTIAGEASRTLTEMREIVAAVRDDDDADGRSPHGIAEIKSLATRGEAKPAIEINISGDCSNISAAVDSAVYRIAQESVTNAVRHAKDASIVTVTVAAKPAIVTVEISDDGHSVNHLRRHTGYGLVGMNERAELLGGSLTAGPIDSGGWAVQAQLPRSGADR